jgi:hypothetical protein
MLSMAKHPLLLRRRSAGMLRLTPQHDNSNLALVFVTFVRFAVNFLRFSLRLGVFA